MITNNCRLIEPIWALWMTNDRGLVWSDQLVRSRVGNTLILAILADLERLHEDEKNQNFELGYTIFSELIHQGYLRELFDLAKDARKEYTLSSHQIILLKILDSKIHAYKESFPSFMGPKELEAVIQLFTVVAKETIQVIIAVKESKSDTRSELEVEQVSNIYTGMVLLLQILNDLAVTDHERQSVKALLVGVDTVSLVTDILGHLESFKLPQSQNENPELGFNYMKRECIRMIGTLCYKDQMIQDEVRNKGAIPLILCQFKIDDSNPYIREYATLALRNVMENNRENQELIAELQPQEVIQSEELTRMGLTPEIMKDGKIRINRTEL
ncbi:spinocerebellar ataxia type 10 protein domain-containing protein [Pilobolus umbonatus]|nr:spinocerebellar ataxia type 10 protein domain-containing protein [Pilobolus umbonatus]